MNPVPDVETEQRLPGAAPFRLIETMRWSEGRVAHRARHRARLRRSAEHFGFAFSRGAFDAALREATAPLAAAPHRLRLTLGADGDAEVEATPLDASGPAPLRVMLFEERIDPADPFFRHKTTWRRVYRRAFAAAQAAGFDDALLVNERGEVTEATRANLFLEMNGTLVTPPVRCGLLPGVGRSAWLEEAGVVERVIGPGDVRASDRCWIVSALRGRRQAVLHERG